MDDVDYILCKRNRLRANDDSLLIGCHYAKLLSLSTTMKITYELPDKAAEPIPRQLGW